MPNSNPRLDSGAPTDSRIKYYPNLPWACQHMCAGYCPHGDGSCKPDPTPCPPQGLRTFHKPLSDRGYPGELQWVGGTKW